MLKEVKTINQRILKLKSDIDFMLDHKTKLLKYIDCSEMQGFWTKPLIKAIDENVEKCNNEILDLKDKKFRITQQEIKLVNYASFSR